MKEEAEEFVGEFLNYCSVYVIAKMCAVLACNKIIEALPKTVSGDGFGSAMFDNPAINYWIEKKKEIEKL